MSIGTFLFPTSKICRGSVIHEAGLVGWKDKFTVVGSYSQPGATRSTRTIVEERKWGYIKLYKAASKRSGSYVGDRKGYRVYRLLKESQDPKDTNASTRSRGFSDFSGESDRATSTDVHGINKFHSELLPTQTSHHSTIEARGGF